MILVVLAVFHFPVLRPSGRVLLSEVAAHGGGRGDGGLGRIGRTGVVAVAVGFVAQTDRALFTVGRFRVILRISLNKQEARPQTDLVVALPAEKAVHAVAGLVEVSALLGGVVAAEVLPGLPVPVVPRAVLAVGVGCQAQSLPSGQPSCTTCYMAKRLAQVLHNLEKLFSY